MPLYDESSYLGRLQKFIDLASPRHLFHTDKEILRCQRLIKDTLPDTNNALKKCESMIAACVHPTTQQVIPAYGRIASFTPVNIPICAGLLFSAPIFSNIILWQWVNQTYNAMFNYCNAAKAAVDFKNSNFFDQYGPILRGYSGAVVVSVSLAVGMTQWLKMARIRPELKALLQNVVPYSSVAAASMSNVALMRASELKTGIPVQAPNGHYVGHSKKAARKALMDTCISRAVLSVPILLLPPPLIALALRWKFLRSSRWRKGLTELLFLTFGIAVGLPCAIALFPQTSKMPLTLMESEIQTNYNRTQLEENTERLNKLDDNKPLVAWFPITPNRHTYTPLATIFGFFISASVANQLELYKSSNQLMSIPSGVHQTLHLERHSSKRRQPLILLGSSFLDQNETKAHHDSDSAQLERNLEVDHIPELDTTTTRKTSIPNYYVSQQSCEDLLENEFKWDPSRPSSSAEIALWSLVLPRNHTKRKWKEVKYALDTLQQTYVGEIHPFQMMKISVCEADPILGRNMVQCIIADGDHLSFQHPFISVLWRSIQKEKELKEIVDKRSNNLLHLAVTSENPIMVEKVFSKIDPYRAPEELLELLESRNMDGDRPVDIKVTPSVRPGIRAFLNKRYKLVVAFFKNKKKFGAKDLSEDTNSTLII